MIKHLLSGNNEEGAAIVIALMAIAALSIIGFSAIDTSVNEMQIVRNDKIYNLNLYKAESINQRGMQLLVEAAPNKILTLHPETSSSVYLNREAVNASLATTLEDPANWVLGVNCTGKADDGTFPNNNPDPDTNPSTMDNEERFAIVYNGIADDGSLSMSAASQMHSYKIYGLSQSNTGEVLIETGYRVNF